MPNPITRIIGSVLHQRSQGVKDLRHGALLEPDGARQPATPWLAAEHFLGAGTLTSHAQHPANLLFGDGLVRVSGASAVNGRPPALTAQMHVLLHVHHLQLTRDRAVYEQISAWCNPKQQE